MKNLFKSGAYTKTPMFDDRNVRPQLLSNNTFVHNNNAATAINHGYVQSFIGGIDSQLLRGTSKATRRSYDCDGQQDCTRKFPHEECPVRGQVPTSLQGASPADIDLRVGDCCCVGNESVMLLASLLIWQYQYSIAHVLCYGCCTR
jgi:hypothetical protein